ncbi:MAG: class II aldolase/adducin family protein, partial [Acinetobacter sp.]
MMTIIQTPLSEQLSTFIDQQREIAEYAFEVFRQSNTITANGTVNFVERVPFEDKLIT